MYENINSLSFDNRNLLLGLETMSSSDVFRRRKKSTMSRKLLGLLGGIGAGKVREPDEPENFPPHFEFLEHFLSAEKEYYFDQEVYGLGAKGGMF